MRMRAALGALLLALVAGTAVAAPADRLALSTLADGRWLEVSLDTSRFPREGVATIVITNPSAFPVEGRVPACDTLFRPADAAYPILRPVESGNFVVGPKQTLRLPRLFRAVQSGKRDPAGTTYRLDDNLDAEPGCRE